jgi:DNA-binding LacI/PurR family transcriptional regulator
LSDQVLKKSKHRQIFEYVHQSIQSGKYKAGQQVPTDGQLMRQFSTSRPTVARAMRDLEQAGFLERRAGSGSFVKIPAQQTISMIGLLIPELGDAELFEPICSEMARTCQKHNLCLLWGDSTATDAVSQERKARDLCHRYIEQKVAGVFFAPLEFSEQMTQVNLEIAEALDQAGIAVILLDRDVERCPNRSRFDLVGIDNFRAGYMQAEYLIGLGSKRIVYVARLNSAPTVDRRIAGYQQAMQQELGTLNPEWVFRGKPDKTEFVGEIMATKPDAIICSNDTTAALLMQSLSKANVSVPQDVRIMGLDDVKYAQLLGVPLTTLSQPCREIGMAAVNAMVQRLENRKMPTRDILLDVQLIVRDSCGGKEQNVSV